MNVWTKIASVPTSGKKAVLCTVVAVSGSTPRHAGAKMLVYEDGSIDGTIGGGNLEKNVIQNALNQLKLNQPKLYRHDLLHQHNMCCGGTVEIFIEPLMPQKKLYIFGAGHTGQALASLALNTDFEVYLFDDRKEYIDQVNDQRINKLCAEIRNTLPLLPFDEYTYAVIATYEHSLDRDILSYCIGKPHAYLGMIGSQRKILMTKKMFTDAGIATTEQVEKVHMPIGINIHAEDPFEIAISIMSELISFKNSTSNFKANKNNDTKTKKAEQVK